MPTASFRSERSRRAPAWHIADAAEATVAAVERGSRGVYNVVDEDPAPGRRVAAGAQITSISSIVNPDKLAYLGPVADFRSLLRTAK